MSDWAPSPGGRKFPSAPMAEDIGCAFSMLSMQGGCGMFQVHDIEDVGTCTRGLCLCLGGNFLFVWTSEHRCSGVLQRDSVDRELKPPIQLS